MSQCEHTHLAHSKHFCSYCKFKFYDPEILRVMGGVDTQKIKLLKLSCAFRYLQHNNYKLFLILLQIQILLPWDLRVKGGAVNKKLV